MDSGEVALVDELALDLVQRGLGLLDEQEPLSPEPDDLAAQLGADRAAGAGHEHDAGADVGGDRLEVHVDLLTPEHVFHLDGADPAGQVVVAREQLVEPGQRLHRDAHGAGDLDDLAPQIARGGRHRDEHLVEAGGRG